MEPELDVHWRRPNSIIDSVYDRLQWYMIRKWLPRSSGKISSRITTMKKVCLVGTEGVGKNKLVNLMHNTEEYWRDVRQHKFGDQKVMYYMCDPTQPFTRAAVQSDIVVLLYSDNVENSRSSLEGWLQKFPMIDKDICLLAVEGDVDSAKEFSRIHRIKYFFAGEYSDFFYTLQSVMGSKLRDSSKKKKTYISISEPKMQNTKTKCSC